MQTLLILLPLCVLSLPVAADTLSGRVVKIADGDTLTLLDASSTQHKIRLSGIDAPERSQPYGTVSRDNLGKLVFGKQVRVDYDKHDRYGRIVGKVLLDNGDANLIQVEVGLAWHYKAYQHEQSLLDRQLYSLSEIQARRRAIGLSRTLTPYRLGIGANEALPAHAPVPVAS